MKRTRRTAVPTLGVVRQRTGEGAPEGAAADCVNLRLKDGALRPVGAAEPMANVGASASAQDVLFHSLLPDGDYLYRVGTTVMHHRAAGDAKVMEFPNEVFVMWKEFGTSLLVVTDKHTMVAVIKDGEWVCLPSYSGSAMRISQNMLEGVSFPSGGGEWSWFALGDNVGFMEMKRDATGTLLTKRWYDDISKMRSKGMVHGFYLAIVCVKLSDGTTMYASAPTYVQHGCTVVDHDMKEDEPSPQSKFTPSTAKAWVINGGKTDDADYSCTIYGGPFFAKPKLRVSIPPDIATTINSLRALNLVSSISLYAQRKQDMYNFEKSFRKYSEIEGGGYLSKEPWQDYFSYKWLPVLNAISPDDPFFLLKEYPLVGDVASTIELLMLPEDFDNLETKEVYRANGSRHTIRSLYGFTEYNSRLHMTGVGTTLSRGDAFPITLNSCQYLPENYYGYVPYSSSAISAYTETTIPVDGANKLVKNEVELSSVLFCTMSNYGLESLAFILPPIVAYPDARASLMRLVVQSNGNSYKVFEIPLKPSLSGNYAYAKGSSDINVTHPPFVKTLPVFIDNSGGAQVRYPQLSYLDAYTNPQPEARDMVQTNRLQVYNYGSPLSYELKNSYRFGATTERLLRCETAVDQLSEGRFGQFPLYCFTDSALYALEQGSGDVLYATSRPISADGLISTKGVTPVRGGVAFVTSKGVMFVSGRTVVELSSPIRGEAEYYDATTGLPDVFRFMDVSVANGGPYEPSLSNYLAGAELHQLYNENELIAYNRLYGYAWVYGMESKMWYRRKLPYESIQRVGTRLVVYKLSGTSLLRLNLEREGVTAGGTMLYLSRPMELESNGYKKVEGAIARLGALRDGVARVYLLGSVDGIRYGVIQGATIVAKNASVDDVRLGRTAVSVRSLVLAVLIEGGAGAAIERVDFELEDRFTSKLR